jgi:inner membrane protein
MDSFTHLVLGAAIGEAILGKKIGRKAMFWGAVANTIPDFDVFASPCVSDAQQFMVHRGITHSFLFAIVVALLLGWAFNKWNKQPDVTWKNWAWLFFTGMLTHDVLDSMTCYGTGWFEPFSNYRVAFDTIFVADPFYTLPFLICVLIALIAKNGSQKRLKWTKIGLMISSLYLIFTFVNKAHVQAIVQESLQKQEMQHTDFVCTPTPLNNFLWMTYATNSTGYWIGYYSIFDKTNVIDYYHIAKNDSLLIPFQHLSDVALLKQFSQGYYCLTKKGNDVYFNDLRFGQLAGWDKLDSTFIFSFNLREGADNSTALNRDKNKMSYSEGITAMINRIKGK